MYTGAKIKVRGLVQGVGFRWFVEREANKLNLNGYVRNLFNGEVEIEAEGQRGLIEELIKKLRVGTRMSHVTGVNVKWLEYQNKYSVFDIRF